jgi:hypothetical protein
MRLLREIARMRKQMHSYRARMSGTIEDSRRLCMECRHLIVASTDHLEQLHVSRTHAARRRGLEVSALRTSVDEPREVVRAVRAHPLRMRAPAADVDERLSVSRIP